jgi:hypothetical protein
MNMKPFASVAVATIFLTAAPAFAHDAPMGWQYDRSCCNGTAHNGDCQRIPHSAVKAEQGGWRITLKPGEHRLVTRPHTWTKGYDQTRQSQDGDFHACLWPDEDTLRCLYVPPMGF